MGRIALLEASSASGSAHHVVAASASVVAASVLESAAVASVHSASRAASRTTKSAARTALAHVVEVARVGWIRALVVVLESKVLTTHPAPHATCCEVAEAWRRLVLAVLVLVVASWYLWLHLMAAHAHRLTSQRELLEPWRNLLELLRLSLS